MSAKLKKLSGKEVVQALEREGFEIVDQHGSHVKLRRIGPDGKRQTLVVPQHHELDRGTLKAIERQAARYLSPGDIDRIFFL